MRKLILTSLCIASSVAANAQNDSLPAIGDQQLQEVQVVQRRPGSVKSRGVVNAVTLTDREFTKAACCNLGESFTTNPSVDVNYSDAATGARQIRLLGLSGTYVQMLTENIPNFRCAALPYSLGYVPGPWMQSIQVSKGCASVKNGHESITGQINIEYPKPQLKAQLNANIYGTATAKMAAHAAPAGQRGQRMEHGRDDALRGQIPPDRPQPRHLRRLARHPAVERHDAMGLLLAQLYLPVGRQSHQGRARRRTDGAARTG